MTSSAADVDARSLLGAYAEGLRYFMGEGALNTALAQVADDLKRHGIDYMVSGAVAMLAHGYPRFTEDIDLVLTAEGLETFHRGPVEIGGVRVVTLDKLVELKLASGMTAPDRLKDLADV